MHHQRNHEYSSFSQQNINIINGMPIFTMIIYIFYYKLNRKYKTIISKQIESTLSD